MPRSSAISFGCSTTPLSLVTIDLCGRTYMNAGDKTFGIAIFEAADEDAARKFMQEDPAVAGGLMTAELHPFAVALQRKNP